MKTHLPKERTMARHTCALAVAVLFGVAGCVAQPKSQPVQSTAETDKLIADALDRIANANQRLAAAESVNSTDTAVLTKYSVTAFPEPLQKKLQLKEPFYGPLDQFINTFCRATGYTPKYVGRRPALTPMVAITSSSRPAIEYLIDAGYQAGSAADIIPPQPGQPKVVEVHWK